MKPTRQFLNKRADNIIFVMRASKLSKKGIKECIAEYTKEYAPLGRLIKKKLKMFSMTITETAKVEEVRTEDGGQAKILTLCEDREQENGIFIDVISWDDTKKHKEFSKLIGKKIRITIEEV